MYSGNFSKYYDVLIGEDPKITTTVTELLTHYAPKHSEVLELGCGTGNMLKLLAREYTVSGLDNSKGMLQIAKKKVPQGSFYHADMAKFVIPKKFDAILCIFDSINHLTTFSDWKRTFTQVNKHLKDNGVFIFDMNTTKRLEFLSKMPPYIKKVNKDTLLCVKMKKTYGVYRGYFQIFDQVNTNNITYLEEIVDESSFELDKVVSSLEHKFTIKKMKDPFRQRITKNSGRVFFVCRKKPQ